MRLENAELRSKQRPPDPATGDTGHDTSDGREIQRGPVESELEGQASRA